MYDLVPPTSLAGPSPEVAGKCCARHRDKTAAALCTRCGDFLCAVCVATPPGEPALCGPCLEVAGATRYYVVPVWRFMVFSLLTFGFYNVYWAYRCWRAVKERDRSDIWPLPRAIFFGFTYFGLRDDLNAVRLGRGLPELGAHWPILHFVMAAATRVVDRMTARDAGAGVVVLSLALVLGMGGTVVPLLNAMREVTSAAELRERDALRTRHIVGFVLGALAFALMVIGLSMGDEPS